jgi:diguanylate cyclase (GGDEF)-like protein/PAS domain S-box-containing protein
MANNPTPQTVQAIADRAIADAARSDGVKPQRSGLGVDLAELLDLSPDFVAVVNNSVELEYVSAGVQTMLGHDPKEWIGRNVLEQIHPDDLQRTLDRLSLVIAGDELGPNELRLLHADGRWIDVELLSRRLRGNDGSFRLVLSIRNVTERQELLRRLTWQAAHDQLTGLLSWSGLQDSFALVSQLAPEGRVEVIRLDIGGLQRVNEFFTHSFGDQVLKLFAERLRSFVDSSALIGRLGGDDFVVVSLIADDNQGHAKAMESAECDPFDVDGVVLTNSVTIGVAYVDVRAGLLVGMAEAESALHAAKRAERDIVVYDEAMRAEGARRRTLESALRTALSQSQAPSLARAVSGDGITMHYQPVVDAVQRTVVGFEALARWKRADGFVSPSEFIPIAEGTGLMIPLGRQLLRSAIGNLAQWRTNAELTGQTVPNLAINVSAAQLHRSEFVGHLSGLLEEFAVPAQHIVLEVTESHVMENLESASASLRHLRMLGCAVAIDDFGTGYSSFGYLRDLPADLIKIDRSFVVPLATDVRSVHIVRAIVDLSKRLGFVVIAEGVETMTQADMLTALGVDRLQGYAFGHAVPAEAAFELIGSKPVAAADQPALA